MRMTELIKRKNKILFDLTGLTLVPFNQVEELEKKILVEAGDVGEGILSDSMICPYCVVAAQTHDGGVDCSDCPMSMAGNSCNRSPDEEDSTYTAMIKKLATLGYSQLNEVPGMDDLVREYNSELKDEMRRHKQKA